MWNTLVGGKKILREGFSGIDTCELARFRNRVKDLCFGVTMDRKIVDRFMDGLSGSGCETSFRKHLQNSSSIG